MVANLCDRRWHVFPLRQQRYLDTCAPLAEQFVKQAWGPQALSVACWKVLLPRLLRL